MATIRSQMNQDARTACFHADSVVDKLSSDVACHAVRLQYCSSASCFSVVIRDGCVVADEEIVSSLLCRCARARVMFRAAVCLC